MKKNIYEQPSMKVVRLKHRTVLLAGSGEPTQPNNVPEYDDWLQ